MLFSVFIFGNMVSSLEMWAFESMVLLSGLLPNPKLETSVLSIWFVILYSRSTSILFWRCCCCCYDFEYFFVGDMVLSVWIQQELFGWSPLDLVEL